MLQKRSDVRVRKSPNSRESSRMMAHAALAVRERRAPEALRVSAPPLTVIKSGVQRQRNRGLLAVAILLLLGAVAGILAINISVSRQQYSLVSLRAQQTQLQAENSRLAEKVDDAQAPQVLAAKAQKLGLVNSTTFAMLDLSTGEIKGTMTPAQDSASVPTTVPAPLAPPTRAAIAPTVDSRKVAESQASVDTKSLNGGTIPAPAQKETKKAAASSSASADEKN